jgi:hypothetical protein
MPCYAYLPKSSPKLLDPVKAGSRGGLGARPMPTPCRAPRHASDRCGKTSSISPVSRMSTGLNSSFRPGAAPCIAAQSPMPAGVPAARNTPTRVSDGAISLSSSSHFTLSPYSWAMKPVVLPRHTLDEAGADRVDNASKHNRDSTVRTLCHRRSQQSLTMQARLRQPKHCENMPVLSIRSAGSASQRDRYSFFSSP